MNIESPVARSRISRELIAVGAIVALYVVANLAILAARPAMMRDAVASVDSLLARDRRRLDGDLTRWRQRMLDDGRWVAGVVEVVLDGQRGPSNGHLSPETLARLGALTSGQMPGARLWLFDARGNVIGGINGDARPRGISGSRS